MRHYTPGDHLIAFVASGLKALTTQSTPTRPTPQPAEQQDTLSPTESKHSAGLMRVNHTGEVCAQALYLSQSLLTRDNDLKQVFRQAASEENDHLTWCYERLQDLNSHRSFLNPLWFAGSFGIGLVAGLCGRGWNLGFLAATEEQVSRHLDSHLDLLPQNDHKSRAIVAQMKTDEMEHANTAYLQGARTLPSTVQHTMQWTAKMMTSIAYYV